MIVNKNSQKLLFVYNANSGIQSAILDSMHKIFSPSTYECNLCDITFGVVSENAIWKKFRQESEHEMVFLHKDEFITKYSLGIGDKFTFPVIFLENEKEVQTFIATKELNGLRTAQELIDLIKKRS